MCRFLAYLGPEVTVQELLLSPAHSLVVQSHSPREMRSAVLNGDGFGVAWYTAAAPEPALYRSVMPMWGDDNLPRMAPHLRSPCVLANVRSATPGIGISLANTQPFVHGRIAFTHNGYIRDFKRTLERPMRDALGDEAYQALGGTSDSEHLFAHLLDALHAAGANANGLLDAVRRSLLGVSSMIDAAKVPALLNVAVTDGRELVAARHAVGEVAPTLYLREGGDRDVVVASERPAADDAFRPLAEGEVVRVRPGSAVEAFSL
ncbi:MAG: ergothioneine biosynthesis protein EgtC [Myxococcota bacterium]